jgi:hypothetical protein
MSHSSHRWSGWPGAICLDCGIEDPLEQCVTDHDYALFCGLGHPQCMDPMHPSREECIEHPIPQCKGKL